MWRLTVFSYLLILHGHATSQPLTDDTENGRPTRQLDFGECCPCPSAGEAESPDTTAQDSLWPAGDRSVARARNLDDCSCRPRYPDSEGASSIFFPTSMRADGPIIRPVEKNEVPKPLLHPEVDLASSVLQTLREATDEEYQDALARDAVRSMAKEAEETIFGDTTPEASTGNIVTIIVNPKHTNDLENEETHVQESRCVHPPLGSIRTNIGKMRVASKPPSLLRDIFGLSKTNIPVEVSQRNLLDIDTSIGASNINERMVHADYDDDQPSNKGKLSLNKYIPLIKLNLNDDSLETPYIKSNNNDGIVNKVPDFKLLSLKNKLSDMVSSRSSKDDKISYLPLIPKIKVNNSFSKQKDNNEDLNVSLNNIKEQVAGKKSFFRTKSHLKDILDKTRPIGLKNFLKLKDVELIPLKDIVDNATKRPKLKKPKLELPAIFNKGTDTFPSHKYKESPNEENKKIIEKMARCGNDEIFEHEVSPSNVIEQISSDNRNREPIKICETSFTDGKDEISSTEVIETVPSPSNTQSVEEDRNVEDDNNHPHELTNNNDDCVIKSLPAPETNLPQTTEKYLYTEAHRSNGDKIYSTTTKNMAPDNTENQQNEESHNVPTLEDCDNNNNESDAITDSSNISNNIVKPADTSPDKYDDLFLNKNIVNEETGNAQKQVSDNFKSLDSIPERKVINPLSLDKALASIKENIIKKLEDLKKQKTISRDTNTTNQKIIRGDDNNNKESASVINENSNADCQNENNQDQENEEFIQNTTLKPDDCNDEDEKAKESFNNISMQDLQKISDSMLQQEEQERESKTAACSEPTKKVIDPKMPFEVNSRETGSSDTEQSANSQNEVVMDPINSVDIHDKNSEEKSCQSDLTNKVDSHTEASDAVINTVFPCNNILESPILSTDFLQPRVDHLDILRSPLPDLQDVMKLEPLPTLEDIKLKLTSLFDKNTEDVEVLSRSEEDTMTEPSNSIMATDASAKSFQSKFPLLRLEDVNLDILQLKPQSSLLSKIPIIDLHSYRTKLPLPNDLRLKPIKLQSALEDNGSIFGATVTVGRNKVQSNNNNKISRVSDNLLKSIPNLNDRTRMKTNLQKILNIPHKPDNLIDKLSDLTDNSNTWRNVQYMLESRIKESSKNPLNLQTHNLFDFEDVSDKLKAIHIDFNDRIETMRNNFKDMSKLGTSDTRNRNTNVKTFMGFSNRNKGKPVSVQSARSKPIPRRESKSKNALNPRRWDQQRDTKIEFPQKLNQKKNKMYASASVPVPRTIEVPELKKASSLRPALQRKSSTNAEIPNVAISSPKEFTLWKPASNSLHNSNSLLEKQINSFKDSKVKVIFSTTSRPTTITAVQSRKITPSSHLQHAPRAYTNLVNSGINSDRETGRSNELTLQRKVPILGPENDFQSRPKFLESPFILKVKENIRTRLSKGNSPIRLQKAGVRPDVEKRLLNKNEDDMSRSASENTDVVVGQTLKENVSYKCRMVCAKD